MGEHIAKTVEPMFSGGKRSGRSSDDYPISGKVEKHMICVHLKLRMTKSQENTCERWLIHLGSVYNFAIRKIELNAADNIYFTRRDFQNLLQGHSKRLDIPSHTLQGVLLVAFDAWKRCFRGNAGKPKFKGIRNKMTSIPMHDPFKSPKGNRIYIPGLGSTRFHKMDIPPGKIKNGRIIRRASGWYLCLFIDAEPSIINRSGNGRIGIDSGFKSLITTSLGEAISHPRELESSERRLAQSQRGVNRKQTARIHEKIANRRKDRNHKLSRNLISENVLIAFSKDRHSNMAKRFGKSVSSSGHAQLRKMLAYKSPKSGTQYIEVDPKNSTRTCSECGSLSGPTGFAGLSVRQWVCTGCGTSHDRDINAAINTLKDADGLSVEGYAHV